MAVVRLWPSRSFRLFMARHVFVNMPLFFGAEHGLKCPTTPGTIQGLFTRPGGIQTVEITELHRSPLSALAGGGLMIFLAVFQSMRHLFFQVADDLF
jgi:hypothetical protein